MNRKNAFLGKQSFDEPLAIESWDGLIDDVAIFDTALSESDIIEIYSNGLASYLGGNDTVPEPASILVWAVLGVVGLMRWKRGGGSEADIHPRKCRIAIRRALPARGSAEPCENYGLERAYL